MENNGKTQRFCVILSNFDSLTDLSASTNEVALINYLSPTAAFAPLTFLTKFVLDGYVGGEHNYRRRCVFPHVRPYMKFGQIRERILLLSMIQYFDV